MPTWISNLASEMYLLMIAFFYKIIFDVIGTTFHALESLIIVTFIFINLFFSEYICLITNAWQSFQSPVLERKTISGY